jgi:anti-anti-sigma factor
VAAWARLGGLDRPFVDDLQLALGEAAANVVDHAYPPGAPGTYDLRATLRTDGGVHVVVVDHGTWRPVPEDKGFRGRGLDLIRTLGREFSVRPGSAGTVVEFVVYPPDPAAAPPPARPADLRPAIVREGGRVEIRGEVDLASVALLRPDLLALLAAATPGEEVHLDLDGATYLASAGVGMLVDLVARASARRVRLVLDAAPGTPAARVLDLAGIGPG